MTNYKSYKIIDGKAKWVITDENSDIINRNPSKEQIKAVTLEDYDTYRRNKFKQELKGRICCICKSDKTYVENFGTQHWYSCTCGKKGCTGHICKECWDRYDPRSSNNLRKLEADFRNGNLNPLSSPGKGFIGVQIIAKTDEVEDCNIKMDNFRFYIDLSHTEFGICEVKISSLNTVHDRWKFSDIKPENFVTLFLVCMDENEPWKDVKRIYRIPSEYIDVVNITIYRNPDISKGSKWEEFRIDEKFYNETYHNMKLKNCKILRSDK